MPIYYEEKYTVLEFEGDVSMIAFHPKDNDGKAGLLLRQGPPGEPGRTLTEEEHAVVFADLDKEEGILIRATDHRSLDVLIRALGQIRDRLRDGPPKTMEQEICEDIAGRVGEDIAAIEDEAFLKMANFPQVTPSDPSSPIPNVGVTPMMLDGVVSLHFEEGVPDNLAEHMLKWTEAEFLIRNTVLLDQPGMERIIVSCRHHMAGLVEQGFLSRDPFDHSKWIYRQG